MEIQYTNKAGVDWLKKKENEMRKLGLRFFDLSMSARIWHNSSIDFGGVFLQFQLAFVETGWYDIRYLCQKLGYDHHSNAVWSVLNFGNRHIQFSPLAEDLGGMLIFNLILFELIIPVSCTLVSYRIFWKLFIWSTALGIKTL